VDEGEGRPLEGLDEAFSSASAIISSSKFLLSASPSRIRGSYL
jgi:hypothetical protein